jgi:ATP adenylyltransferase
VKQLWAPWRLEYIQSADEQEGCVFCRVQSLGDEEGLFVHRGERAFVVLNKYPYASGHVMVAPARHVGALGELDEDEALEIHRFTATSVELLTGSMGAQGFSAGPATPTSCPCSPT